MNSHSKCDNKENEKNQGVLGTELEQMVEVVLQNDRLEWSDASAVSPRFWGGLH